MTASSILCTIPINNSISYNSINNPSNNHENKRSFMNDLKQKDSYFSHPMNLMGQASLGTNIPTYNMGQEHVDYISVPLSNTHQIGSQYSSHDKNLNESLGNMFYLSNSSQPLMLASFPPYVEANVIDGSGRDASNTSHPYSTTMTTSTNTHPNNHHVPFPVQYHHSEIESDIPYSNSSKSNSNLSGGYALNYYYNQSPLNYSPRNSISLPYQSQSRNFESMSNGNLTRACHFKKRRRRLNSDETKILTEAFDINSKPSTQLREELAKKLNMTSRAIQIWFQNRRAKMKRETDDISHYPMATNSFIESQMDTNSEPSMLNATYSMGSNINQSSNTFNSINASLSNSTMNPLSQISSNSNLYYNSLYSSNNGLSSLKNHPGMDYSMKESMKSMQSCPQMDWNLTSPWHMTSAINNPLTMNDATNYYPPLEESETLSRLFYKENDPYISMEQNAETQDEEDMISMNSIIKSSHILNHCENNLSIDPHSKNYYQNILPTGKMKTDLNDNIEESLNNGCLKMTMNKGNIIENTTLNEHSHQNGPPYPMMVHSDVTLRGNKNGTHGQLISNHYWPEESHPMTKQTNLYTTKTSTSNVDAAGSNHTKLGYSSFQHICI